MKTLVALLMAVFFTPSVLRAQDTAPQPAPAIPEALTLANGFATIATDAILTIEKRMGPVEQILKKDTASPYVKKDALLVYLTLQKDLHQKFSLLSGILGTLDRLLDENRDSVNAQVASDLKEAAALDRQAMEVRKKAEENMLPVLRKVWKEVFGEDMPENPQPSPTLERRFGPVATTTRPPTQHRAVFFLPSLAQT